MPRKARKQSQSGIYHVMLRGIDRQLIFEDSGRQGTVLCLDGNLKRGGRGRSPVPLSQSIPLSGAAGDSYVFSGWAKGRSAALDGLLNGIDKEYALQLTFTNTDGTTTTETVQFNHNMPHWQYAAAAAVAEKAYSGITIKAIFNNNANTEYFDGLQLFKEEFGTSYTYDSDGNVISVVDLQKKNTTYEYSDNNLTKIIQDGVTKFEYTYDNWHNVKTATTDEELTYSFTYDDYGNNTEVSISATDEVTGAVSKITSKAVYSADGNLMVKSIDALGNETQYGYDADTGLVQWIQYPEDTAATRTEYTYDSMYRTARVSADLDSTVNRELYASYGYSDDLLTSIQTPTTHYSFTYGDFSLRTRVDIGDRNLAQYSYESGTNRLQRLDYGNGDRVQYTYDSQGRLITETYEDGETVTYAYDNSGNLATVFDSDTGIVTTYYYDLLNRQAGYRETGGDAEVTVKYAYDDKNNLASMTETIDGTVTVYTYTYDEDNRLISETVDGVTVTYTYDGFGRLTAQTVKQGETVKQANSYTYNDTETTATPQIKSYNGLSYTYDGNGNILTVSDGTNVTSYVYDSANQLIRENNQALGFTHTWTYDNAGNILSRKEYAYTTAADLQSVSVANLFEYDYQDEQWGDLLTFYDGDVFTYDEVGNPTSDGNWTYTWRNGRQLASMSKGSTTWSYIYDANGMRTNRNSRSTRYSYVYDGGRLVQLRIDGLKAVVLNITYDATGRPLTIENGHEMCYYVLNVQGDVIGLKDMDGELVTTYTYDAWGNVHINGSSQIGDVNPLLYRGYVYNYETGLYYLQSRYYDPNVGRFLNADGLVSTGQGILGHNMYAYCQNNPVMYCDDTGHSIKLNISYYSDGRCSALYYRDVTEEIDAALKKEIMQIKEDYYYPTIESFYFPTSTFNHFWDAVDAFSKVYIIDDFIRKVKPEGPWDIKLRDAWEATIGTKFPGQNTTVIYHGQKTTAHELGNYTYGVIGRAYGFPVDVLILGSFVAAGLPLYGNDLTNELSDWPFIKAGFYAGGAFYE